ncbi:glycosyltransferase family 4 protein [Rhodobacteraceae bacterium nBUS_24]
MKREKVLFISNTYWSLWNFRRNLVAAFYEKKYNVTLLGGEDRYFTKFDHQKFKCHSLSRGFVFSPFLFILKTIILIVYQKPKVVFSYTHLGNISAGLARKLIGFKYVANISGLGRFYSDKSSHRFFTTILTILIKLSLTKASTIFVQNKDDKDWLLGLLPSKENNIILLPGSGTDLRRFKYWKPEKIYGTEKKRILMMSRLLPEKGVDWFLEAARDLNSLCLDFTLIGSRDPKHPGLHDLVEKYHQHGIVNYYGHVDDVTPYICEAYCVVLPTRYREGTPKSLIEALAVGKPIITTDTPGCRDTVNQNGLLISSYEEFIDALKTMINKTELEYIALCESSRHLAETTYDESIVIERYLNEI